MVAPMDTWAYVNLDGTIAKSEETWNPRALACAALACVRSDVGVYDVTAPEGVELLGGQVTAQYTPGVVGVVESITDGRTARVHLTIEGTDTDCAFVLELLEA